MSRPSENPRDPRTPRLIPRGPRTPRLLAASILPAVFLTAGCSLKGMAINTMADTLAASGDVYASDDDPELVRDALPFSLKTVESLLASSPRHQGLLLAACSGFTSYAYAFVQTEAELLESVDYGESSRLQERAIRLYLRGRDYCLRALEVKHPGLREAFLKDPKGALVPMTVGEVPLLYWTGASWGGPASIGLDRPDLVADLPTVKALMDRALELDEDYSQGSIHEVLISLEAAGQATGGSLERARSHFERAVELSRGLRAGPYVTLATSVSVPEQNRGEFERLLRQALAVDPDKDKSNRLANLIAQKRARHLLEKIDELFPGDRTHEGHERREA